MKTRTLIIIGIIAIFAVSSFYIFIVFNGYSPYYEGLGLIYFSDTPPEKRTSNGEYWKYEIRKITDDDLADAPIIKTMLQIALTQEFPLHSSGFTEIVEFKSYRVMRDGEDIRVQNYMSSEDVEKYQNWISDNIPSSFFEYDGKIFGIGSWVA